jgi:hypothetical protein
VARIFRRGQLGRIVRGQLSRRCVEAELKDGVGLGVWHENEAIARVRDNSVGILGGIDRLEQR